MSRPSRGGLKGRRIVVTGSAGFIGRPAAEALRKAGATVIATTRTHAPLPEGVKELEKSEPGCVVHCAAVLPPRLGGTEGLRSVQANLSIDEAVDQLCLSHGWRLVFLSGTSVYGEAPIPWREQSPTLPVGPYAREKVTEEHRIRDSKIDACILRVSSPYGWRQKVRTVVRVFIDAAHASRDLTYHGSGARQQDFINVDDVVSAILCAAAEGAPAGVFNIASGRSVSMKELAEIVVAAVPGCTSKVVPSGAPDPQEESRVTVDITKAKEQLGWSPRVSLEDGVRKWAELLRPGE